MTELDSANALVCHLGRWCTNSFAAGMTQGVFQAMVNDMRAVIRVAQGRSSLQPGAAILDARTLQSSCESGSLAGYEGYKRRRGSKVHMAVDTLGQLLTLTVTAANEQERSQVGQLCQRVRQVTCETAKVAWVDQGYTGE